MRTKHSGHYQKTITRRKWLTLLASLTLLYPVFRFIRFNVPKKPVYIEVVKPVATSGFHIAHQFILFDRDGSCWALSRKCTHLGCTLNYHEESDTLTCPCHSSRFEAKTGAVLEGPAKKNLSFFPVEKKTTEPYYVVTT